MTDHEKIERVDKLVLEAGTLAELPESVVSGFDGDSWLWAWSERLDQDRDVEIHFRVQTNLLTHLFETELFGFARLVAQPSITCRTPRRSLDDFAVALESFVEEQAPLGAPAKMLASFLATTHDEARDCAEALEELQERNEQVRNKLEAIVQANQKKRKPETLTR